MFWVNTLYIASSNNKNIHILGHLSTCMWLLLLVRRAAQVLFSLHVSTPLLQGINRFKPLIVYEVLISIQMELTYNHARSRLSVTSIFHQGCMLMVQVCLLSLAACSNS